MKISVITATYNSEKTIADTIKSVLKQSYKNIEYIIIDGHSYDGTLEIIKKYEHLFGGRLKWISEEDKGLYDAMNKGVKMATGEIVGILNSDDYFTSNYVLQNVAETFQKEKVIDAVYGDIHFIRPESPDRIYRYYSSALFRPRFMRFGFMPPHPSLYVKRELYVKYGYYSLDFKIASDFELMVRFFCTNKVKSKYIRMDFVTMRTGGVSTKNIKSRLLGSKEDVLACRKNGIYTNIFFICVKYLYKVFEFIPILKRKAPRLLL